MRLVGAAQCCAAWGRGGAQVAGHVAGRQAERARAGDHQTGKILADPGAARQHLGDRRVQRGLTGLEGEILVDPPSKLEQARQHRAAGREAGRGIGAGSRVGRGHRAGEGEFGVAPCR
jgi:hypothetical protein